MLGGNSRHIEGGYSIDVLNSCTWAFAYQLGCKNSNTVLTMRELAIARC